MQKNGQVLEFSKSQLQTPKSQLLKSFQNGDGGGIMVGVTQAEQDRAAASGLKQVLALAMQDDKRLAAGFLSDFDVVPTELGADTGAEGFGHGFLGGDARCQERGREFVLQTILDLGRKQNAVQEPLAEALMRRPNAFHFDNVDPNAE